MPNLVVAVDGSKHSERVVDAACEVAKQMGDSIILILILRGMPEEPEGVKAFEETEHYREAYTRYLESAGLALTRKLGERIESRGVQYTSMTEFGSPSDKILETAELQRASVIVMGLHGLHYVGRIRSLGSVSRTVIEKASCPVMVVP